MRKRKTARTSRSPISPQPFPVDGAGNIRPGHEWEVELWRAAHEVYRVTKPGGVWLCRIPPGSTAYEYERLLAAGMDPGFGYAVTIALAGWQGPGTEAERGWWQKILDGSEWMRCQSAGADFGFLVFIKPGPGQPETQEALYQRIACSLFRADA